MLNKISLKSITISLLKGLLAFIIWQLGLIIGTQIAGAFGFPSPPVPDYIDPNLLMLRYLPIGIALAIMFGELFKKLNQRFLERFLCIFLTNFLIYGFLQVLEQVIFTTTMNFAYGIIYNLVQSLFFAFAIAFLWKPNATDRSIIKELPKYCRERNMLDWTWRIVVAWLMYIPLYYIVGVIISPIVTPYYTDPSLNLGLVLPDVKIMILIQFIRGALYLLSVFPILFLWKESKKSLWIWTGFIILIQITATPILVAYWLPKGFRLVHALELATHSFIPTFVYIKLLFIEKEKITT